MRIITRFLGNRWRNTRVTRFGPFILLLAFFLSLTLSGTAYAAEFAEGEIYRLQAGETVSDDLYVFAQEITIDGTVEGDVIAFGGIIEINGTVTGDLIAAGAGITVNGEVQDDVRAAGSGIVIAGTVGDDLLIAGGGGLPGMPINIGTRSVTPGIRVTQGAQIGGDTLVAGDRGDIAGQTANNFFAGMNSLEFNAQVGGNAQLHARSLTIGNAAQVDGTLRYSTEAEMAVPNDVASDVVAMPWDQAVVTADDPAPASNTAGRMGWWLARLILVSLGLALAGWLVLTFAPGALLKPATMLEHKLVESGIAGIIAVALALPLGAALIFLCGIFWGPFPGAAAMTAFFFGALGLIWIFSPLVVGLWLGRKILAAFDRELGALSSLLIGALIIIVLARLFGLVPCAGQLAGLLLYLVSFALAVGSSIMAWLSTPKREIPALAEASVQEPDLLSEPEPSDEIEKGAE